MRFKKQSHINKLMVLASSVCNLQCEYCYLRDQHKNSSYVLLNKEIQKAWLDGSYVENIKKVFNEIGSDPKLVNSLEIWGGEPLIIVSNLINPIKEILTYFTNLSSIDIPTNFTRVNNLIDFIYAIDEIKAKQKAKQKLDLHIQMSIDAPPGPMQAKGHDFNWDLYRKNIDTLCSQLASGKPVEHVFVGLELHATLPLETILNHLNTPEAIKNYCDYFNNFHLYIEDTIKKYKLESVAFQIAQTTFPHTAIPDDTSIEDSLDLRKILYLSRYIEQHSDYALENRGNHIYTKNACSAGESVLLQPNPVCIESGLMAVTIMYDGSICECPCDYILSYDKYWDWVTNNPLLRKQYRESMYKKQFYINPLTASQKEKDDFDWYVYDSVRLGTSTALHLMINYCLEMAKSGQIDYLYYKDPELLLKHLTQFNQEYSCPKDQLVVVHNSYTSTPNPLRRYFNGIAEMAQNDYKKDIQFEVKGLYKWDKIQDKFVQ